MEEKKIIIDRIEKDILKKSPYISRD